MLWVRPLDEQAQAEPVLCALQQLCELPVRVQFDALGPFEQPVPIVWGLFVPLGLFGQGSDERPEPFELLGLCEH